MNIVHALLLGVVEGVTEFLPISSTAHLILTSKFLGLAQNEFQTFFEVFIQSGAILAVVFLYLRYVLEHKKALINITLSFIPTAVVGLLLHKIIKTVFFNSNPLIIASMAVVAIVFLIVEDRIRTKKLELKKNIRQITNKQAVLIGLIQSLAVVPGVSRAGIVMVFMMMLGFKRDESAKYSFLLAMPTIIAASALDLYQSKEILLASSSMTSLLIVGFVTAFITAYVSVKWLLNYLQNNTLVGFAYYRLLLAIIVIIALGL